VKAWQRAPSTAKALATGDIVPLVPVAGLCQGAGGRPGVESSAARTAACATVKSDWDMVLANRLSGATTLPVDVSSSLPKIGPSGVEMAQPPSVTAAAQAIIGRSPLSTL